MVHQQYYIQRCQKLKLGVHLEEQTKSQESKEYYQKQKEKGKGGYEVVTICSG